MGVVEGSVKLALTPNLEAKRINRVVYYTTSKSPGTIEGGGRQKSSAVTGASENQLENPL